MSDISVGDLARLDESGVTREHWKIMFISGMGFFTDAYDLFICFFTEFGPNATTFVYASGVAGARGAAISLPG